MADDADDLNLQADEAQAGPAGALGEESEDLDLESAVADESEAAAPADQPDAKEQETWSPERKAAYTQATQKYSAQLKAAQAELAAAKAARESEAEKASFWKQQLEEARRPAPTKEEEPGEPASPEMVGKLEGLLKKTSLYREMQQEKAALREFMASKPEAFVDAEEVDPDVLAEITPQLREFVNRLPHVDLQTVKLMAKGLAAPRQAKLLREHKAADAKREQARAAKRAEFQKAQTAASSGMETGVEDFGSLSEDQQEEVLEKLLGQHRID